MYSTSVGKTFNLFDGTKNPFTARNYCRTGNILNSNGKFYCYPATNHIGNIGEYEDDCYIPILDKWKTFDNHCKSTTYKIISIIIQNPHMRDRIAETKYSGVVKYCLNFFLEYVPPHEIIKMDFLSTDEEMRKSEIRYIVSIILGFYYSCESRNMMDSFKALINKLYDLGVSANDFSYLFPEMKKERDLYYSLRWIIISDCLIDNTRNNLENWDKWDSLNGYDMKRIIKSAFIHKDEVLLTTLVDREFYDFKIRNFTTRCYYGYRINHIIKKFDGFEWLQTYINEKNN